MRDYYAILGCTKESTREDIKRAYHERVLQFHPDKNNALGENTEAFQRITEAWKTLSCPETRKRYDVACRQAELDAECNLVYVRTSISDLTSNEDESLLTYPCRCGSTYCIDRESVQEKGCTIHVPCQECTFVMAIDT